ncbi:MAG TPA: Mrp/NBP35 family ATP-binding protein [Blastocatellia bacterium]|nr:Mrp/NBP35 family ATP-binding protein [Blastocatellia bacterium]
MAELTKEQILEALRAVVIPQVERDIVSMGIVRDVAYCDGIAAFNLVLPPPLAIFKEPLLEQAKRTLLKVPEIKKVNAKAEVATPKAPEKLPLPGIKNIIAVSSGKGGVGKSTVAVNIAVALAQQGFRVGLMDSDVYGPNVPIMMGVTGTPRTANNKVLPIMAHGVKVMSIGIIQPGEKPVVWRGPMLHGVVKQFLQDVEWGQLDYLLVDMPPGTGDVQLSLAQIVPVTGAILVTTPQEVSMSDVRKATNMFLQVQVPIIGIVENMSYFLCPTCSEKHEIFGHGGGATLARHFNVPFLGEVPLSLGIREGGDEGLPVVAGAPDSPQAQAFKQITANVIQEIRQIAAPLPTIGVK